MSLMSFSSALLISLVRRPRTYSFVVKTIVLKHYRSWSTVDNETFCSRGNSTLHIYSYLIKLMNGFLLKMLCAFRYSSSVKEFVLYPKKLQYHYYWYYFHLYRTRTCCIFGVFFPSSFTVFIIKCWKISFDYQFTFSFLTFPSCFFYLAIFLDFHFWKIFPPFLRKF